MAEQLVINSNVSKEEKYKTLIPQLVSLTENEKDFIANLANISAVLKQTFGFFWVGFYLVKNNQLVLGPFQGSLACTRISIGKGVCGTAWQNKQSVVVPNVDEFPGHIACSSESKSEIVIPLFSEQTIFGVLDVDSDVLNDFDNTDKNYLEEIAKIIARCYENKE